MEKKVVITTAGKVEFSGDYAAELAQDFFDTNKNICIEIIDVFENIEVPKIIKNEDVAMWRVRTALIFMGLKSQVDAAIDSLPEPSRTIAQQSWEYGNTINRASPITEAIKSMLKLSPEQFELVFTTAENINV